MRFRTSPFLTDVILTTITSFAVSVGVIVTTRLLAQGLGQAGFGTYSISRRFVTTLTPLTMLGMGMAISRYVAVLRDPASVSAFLRAGFLLGVIPAVVFLIAGTAAVTPLAAVVFHDASQTPALIASLLGVLGYSTYSVLYGYYRGAGHMTSANAWQLFAGALGPVAVAWALASSQPVSVVLFWMSGLYLMTLLPLGGLLWRTRWAPPPPGSTRAAARELYEYGVPRIGAGMLFGAILAIGPVMAQYVGTKEDVGYIAAGQSVIGLAATAIGAFSLVGLPKVAQLVSDGRAGFLRERVADLVALIVHVGLFTAVQLLVWSDLITVAWLGVEYAPAIPLMRIMLVSVLPYTAFEVLRSVIDAIEKRPVNLVNLAWAFGIVVAGCLAAAVMGQGIAGLTAGTAIGISVLGLLTIQSLRKTGWIAPVQLHWPYVIGCNVVGAGAAWLSRTWVLAPGLSMAGVVRAGMIETLLFPVYWVLLRSVDVNWIRQVEERLIHRRAGSP